MITHEEAIENLDKALLEGQEMWTHGLDSLAYRKCAAQCGEYTPPWRSPEERSASDKGLPYWDQQTFEEMLEVQAYLVREPVIQGAASKLVSYVVGTGHQYEPCRLPPTGTGRPATRALDVTENQIKAGIMQTLANARLGADKGWLSIQEETYRRKVRGEYFRRCVRRGDTVKVWFIEPTAIKQPQGWNQVSNPGAVPENAFRAIGLDELGNVLRALPRPTDTVVGELGVVSDFDDASEVLGYWVQGPDDVEGTPVFDFVPAREVQHGKMLVDSNDPRGVPLFYAGTCYIRQVRKILDALVQVMLVQSKYAAIHMYKDAIRVGKARAVAKAIGSPKDDEPEQIAPGIHHMKNTQVELPSTKVRTANWVQIVSQLLKLFAASCDLPDFMVSASVGEGNRSSLISAEGPFDIKNQREQKLLSVHDIDVMWKGIAAFNNWSFDELTDAQSKFLLIYTAKTQLVRDFSKNVKALIDLATPDTRNGRERFITPQVVAAVTGFDYGKTTEFLSAKPESETPTIPTNPAGTGVSNGV